ncbi:MAG TPA: xanthine dehydrogenase family protein subunit M [Gaiellaceae bacterium]|nr:xanthine dehydrogenase family protein subunit M [Gaiellaceae bacterium]
MEPFAYRRAATVEDALATPGATFLGGGTNLVDLMRLGVAAPGRLVDVSRLNAEIEETPDGGLRVGAGVRNNDLAFDTRVRERWPAVAQALLAGASGQLRNLATTGGNLLQRTRCSYFQDVTKPCNKREPGSGCPAIEGDHHNLAILGWSQRCVATHPSDLAVALVAFDALVHTSRRTLPLAELHRLPGDEPARDSVLERDELIVAVELPPLPLARRSAYRKVRERASFAFALVSVAAAYDGEDVRIALGGVAHTPWRAAAAEQAIRGGASFRDAAEAELAQARPLRDNAYKVPLAVNTIVRVLEELAG